MKHSLRCPKLIIVSGALLLFVSPYRAQDLASSLLAKLDHRPIDEATLMAIERQPLDPQTEPALKAAFAQGGSKRELQWIAAAIIRLGDRSERYYEFLAGYAREAINDRTPSFASYDSTGHTIRGKFDPGFENWCALNDKDPKAVAAIQISSQPEDVLTLAAVNDVRSRELLRNGLESPNALIVAYSVQGLGRLQDWDAVPLIEKASRRLPPGEHLTIAMQLPWYASPEADRLMRQLLPDANMREYFTREVRRRQAAELEAVQRRNGAIPPK